MLVAKNMDFNYVDYCGPADDTHLISQEVGANDQSISTNADGAGSVFVANMDGSGDVDVLNASWGEEEIALYPNIGIPSQL